MTQEGKGLSHLDFPPSSDPLPPTLQVEFLPPNSFQLFQRSIDGGDSMIIDQMEPERTPQHEKRVKETSELTTRSGEGSQSSSPLLLSSLNTLLSHLGEVPIDFEVWRRLKGSLHPGIVRVGVRLILKCGNFSSIQKRSWGHLTHFEQLAAFDSGVSSHPDELLEPYLSSIITFPSQLSSFLEALAYNVVSNPFNYSSPRHPKAEYVRRTVVEWTRASTLADSIEKAVRRGLPWALESTTKSLPDDRGYSKLLLSLWLREPIEKLHSDLIFGVNELVSQNFGFQQTSPLSNLRISQKIAPPVGDMTSQLHVPLTDDLYRQEYEHIERADETTPAGDGEENEADSDHSMYSLSQIDLPRHPMPPALPPMSTLEHLPPLLNSISRSQADSVDGEMNGGRQGEGSRVTNIDQHQLDPISLHSMDDHLSLDELS